MAVVEAYHRKYRPKTVAEYIGNTKLKQSVKNMLHNNNRPQVIMLQGHSGCGKTTMARLLAKEYCCENRDDEKGACGVCDNCKAFDEYIESGESGGLMDLNEIDSGKVGKSEAETIMAEMEAPTYSGGWKTFIFDESHLLTAGAMGGLLKMVEEPPEKVLIVFCTTDPERMLDTLLSRCQYILTVTKPERKELCELLARVCMAEGKKYEDKGLSLICTAGDYVPRNTLTSLESVIVAKDNALYESAVEVLNAVSDTYYFQFYEIMTERRIDVFKYIAFLGTLKERIKLDQFLDGLLAFTKRGIYVYNGIKVDGVEEGEMKQYQKIFNSFRTVDIAYILNTLLDIRKSSDIEARLILLGYEGLRKPKEHNVIVDSNENLLKKADVKSDVAHEKNLSSDAFRNMTTASDMEITKIANNGTAKSSIDDVMKAFNVTQFTGDKSLFD